MTEILENSCRICNKIVREVIDIGSSPPANNFISSLDEESRLYPLIVDFCDSCSSLQLRNCLNEDDLYKNYSYMTPDTDSQIQHYEILISYLKERNIVDNRTNCLELGSNTGLFLKSLEPNVGSVLGIDPAENIAAIANREGVKTIAEFFTPKTASKILKDYGAQDLVIARHMFAHNKFPKPMLEGVCALLSENGSFIIENAYAIPTLENGELDQIYHEHMFYYSVKSMQTLLDFYSLEITSLLETSLHGGSLVFIASRKGSRPIEPIVEEYVEKEDSLFLEDKIFSHFNENASSLKDKVLQEIRLDQAGGKRIGAYGATAKAFTLFSFLGLDNSDLEYCVDTTPTKIGKIFPFFNIPVISEEQHTIDPVDSFIVTAWNYKDHIVKKAPKFMKKGTKLIFPLPYFEVIEV
tara:strand:+ start:10122 stop:11351 length:1230 start_codon:yes stop_codon:yes gene_type:complete